MHTEIIGMSIKSPNLFIYLFLKHTKIEINICDTNSRPNRNENENITRTISEQDEQREVLYESVTKG
jgi:hypothetical protein